MKRLRIIMFIGLVGILLNLSISSFAISYGDFGAYKYENINTTSDRFVNNVDGYSIEVPVGMNVDMSKSEVVSSLSKNELVINIYRQVIESGSSAQSYINYGNKFIENTANHKKEHFVSTVINGRKITALQWTRPKLARVNNDKNYYASIDIIDKGEVYTVFFKSSVPLYSVLDYMKIIKSFKIFDKTAKPMAFKSKVVENPSWNEKTKLFYEEHFIRSNQLEWGIFEPYFPSTDKLKRIEAQLEYKLNYVILYTHVKDDDASTIQHALNVARGEGRTIELTLQTRPEKLGEKNAVYGILNGDFDNYLDDYAKRLAEYGEPILFRLGNEMNGDWCSYSGYHTSKDAAMYVEMYKYIYNRFEKAGANANVIWVWNPNAKSFPNFIWNNELMYYPGDEYVNVVGMTAYNTGTYYRTEKWISFKDLYTELYNRYTRKYAQPLMITEFASSSIGGDKVQWVREMFDTLYSFPQIKVAIWWNGADYDGDKKIARPYFIDDIQGVMDEFKLRLKNN